MSKLLSFVVVFGLLIGVWSGCATVKPSAGDESARDLPRADREFRAAWVATVDNIDWPSKPGLSVEDQQREIRTILDTAVVLHLNAIVLQVRPHCDAMYQSTLEPWSFYLTGMQGKAPEPYYDPLTYWITEAHNRGLELHAWFNPYRAHMARSGEVTDSSIVRKKPDLAKKLANGTYWLDPAKKGTQDHSYNVVMDVVRRYDIDGVHFDDYFYPYGDGNFPDDDSWAEYTANGGSMSRQDWRRSAVNTFIERLYDGIKSEKPYVKFGISPFGIWRPGNPPSIAGFDQFNGLYADAKLWLNKGWVDYWSPQLYWPINQAPQSFPVLLGWWTRENVKGRNLWPGMIVGRMTNEKGTDEIINQIMIERGFVPEGPGHIHFSMKAFLRDSSVLNAGLKTGPYQRMALVPPSPWLGDRTPVTPRVDTSVVRDTLTVSWSHPDSTNVFRWVVYAQYGTGWQYTIYNRSDRTAYVPLSRVVRDAPPRRRRPDQPLPAERTEYLTRIAVSAVDRLGNESDVQLSLIPPRPAEPPKPADAQAHPN